jgi:hypothetical protein
MIYMSELETNHSRQKLASYNGAEFGDIRNQLSPKKANKQKITNIVAIYTLYL